MQPIPDDVLSEFNATLRQKGVPTALHDDYRKWLLYYLDFRMKYPPPDSKPEQVRLFIEKLRSKKQPQKYLNQAAHALSLFFSLRTKAVFPEQRSVKAGTELPAPPPAAMPPGPRHSEQSAVANSPIQRGGKKYNEWWSLERTRSPEWDTVVIDRLAGEIKARHYSRKTLKAYADWCRKFQIYLKHKPPDALSSADVKCYLTYLAVECKVSASTQNQAFNALLFLFRHILKKDFGDHKDVPRAKRSTYIPVVLTRQEIDSVLFNLSHPYTLVVKLLYGCGPSVRMPEITGAEFQLR